MKQQAAEMAAMQTCQGPYLMDSLVRSLRHQLCYIARQGDRKASGEVAVVIDLMPMAQRDIMVGRWAIPTR